MAEQNKTVMIAVIVILGVAVIATGSYFLWFSDSTPPPTQQVVNPAPVPKKVAPKTEEKKERRKRGQRKVEEEPEEEIKYGERDKRIDEMTPEEIKKRTGRTDKPRGVMP